MTDRLMDQVDYALDAYWYNESSLNISAACLIQQPRKSHFVCERYDRTADGQTDKVNNKVASLPKKMKHPYDIIPTNKIDKQALTELE